MTEHKEKLVLFTIDNSGIMCTQFCVNKYPLSRMFKCAVKTHYPEIQHFFKRGFILEGGVGGMVLTI